MTRRSNDLQIECRAVRESIGLLDRSARGRLVLTGSDRFSWLQGMVSNDVRLLEAGVPRIQACILNATGHMLAEAAIVRRSDSLLLDLDRAVAERILRLLDDYIITEDVEIVDQSDFLACLSVQGPQAKEGWVRALAGEDALVVPADRTGEGGFDLYVKAVDAPALREKLAGAGAIPVGEEAAEALRVEAGIPAWGAELDESVIPLEANLEATHICYQKGCYVGQEIIARIHSRGHTNRALTGLLLEGEMMPVKGDAIYPAEGETEKEAGRITSAVRSLSLGRGIALGFVRHERRAPGTGLSIVHEGDILNAVVTPLPFCGRAS
jgi:folate-binding protein YgfZ